MCVMSRVDKGSCHGGIWLLVFGGNSVLRTIAICPSLPHVHTSAAAVLLFLHGLFFAREGRGNRIGGQTQNS